MVMPTLPPAGDCGVRAALAASEAVPACWASGVPSPSPSPPATLFSIDDGAPSASSSGAAVCSHTPALVPASRRAGVPAARVGIASAVAEYAGSPRLKEFQVAPPSLER